MRQATRTFGAVISHDVVCLVEYQRERAGARVLGQWVSHERSVSIDDALTVLLTLISARGAFRPRLSIAIENFGVFHHAMTLPDASDEVLQPIVQREVQRLFSVSEPVIAFTRGVGPDRGETSRSGSQSAQAHLFIGGAPRETTDTIRERLAAESVTVEIVTVVPKAIHSSYEAAGASPDPTAVLVCFGGGPHLAFLLGGRLELAIDPPIAVEGDRDTIQMMLDQVERGSVYFRQQFRGATATQLLLSACGIEFEALSSALEQRLGLPVTPLFAGATSPEAVVAMGAALESSHADALDFFPHPATPIDRARAALRGPNAVVAGLATAAVIAGIWTTVQFWSLTSARRESASIRAAIRAAANSVEPMRVVAETRADLAHTVEYANATRVERAGITAALRAVAEHAPVGVRFDSMNVARSAPAWVASISGESSGMTAAEAVRGLDGLYQTIRVTPGVESARLDEFDYTATPAADSTRNAGLPVRITFRVSFTIAPVSERADR